jgi:hypothetical protein
MAGAGSGRDINTGGKVCKEFDIVATKKEKEHCTGRDIHY